MCTPSVSSLLERGDSDRRLVMSIWAKWMVRHVRVLAANAFVCAWNGLSGLQVNKCCLCSVLALDIAGAMRVFRWFWKHSRDRGGNMPTVPVYRYDSHDDYNARKSKGGSFVPVNCSMADLVRYSLDNGHFEGRVVTSKEGELFYRSIPDLLWILIGCGSAFWRPMTIVMPKLAIKGLCHSIWA